MKSRVLIIIGVVLIIGITITFVLNYYIDEEIKVQKFNDEQIDRIFKRCDYQKMMDDRNWIGFDGNKITDHQPLYGLDNSTHYIDNNICEWQTIEKYESDVNFRNALSRCWTGNSEFLEDDFVLWNNVTHHIDTDTCLITEVTHSGVSIDRTVNPIPFGTSDEDLKSKAYIVNCDETLHKEKLPDLTIENSTHNYDMQYCKWELKYPDLTLITNENLPNGSPYCAELFDTLFDYYQSIRDDCGMQRYNEDGTPRGVCEPAPAGAGIPYDVNMIKSGCIDHYADWAYQTEHNDGVFYLFGR